MTVVFDTDAMLILGACDLLASVAEALGVELADCYHLPALPYQLKVGREFRRLSEQARERIGAACGSMQPLPDVQNAVSDALSAVVNIDDGERLMAAALVDGVVDVAVTGDKRALRAFGAVLETAPGLTGRWLCMEDVLLSLCECLDAAELIECMQDAVPLDKMVKSVFPAWASERGVRDGLLSYRAELARSPGVAELLRAPE